MGGDIVRFQLDECKLDAENNDVYKFLDNNCLVNSCPQSIVTHRACMCARLCHIQNVRMYTAIIITIILKRATCNVFMYWEIVTECWELACGLVNTTPITDSYGIVTHLTLFQWMDTFAVQC